MHTFMHGRRVEPQQEIFNYRHGVSIISMTLLSVLQSSVVLNKSAHHPLVVSQEIPNPELQYRSSIKKSIM